ncbi:NAD(P)-binding protein [Lysobacter capsici]|uniref:NAD(P)-binding protein n=1 Tax=Lysobacter capsici TaxID=435897 RepID=UPI00287BB433|nr:FAD-dependent oxidoreductase [Lysobacter capsici]WND78596.1 FAD-dependent oxidoreductase [Lysobacter capsici]WND83791.1 FAD-dependent oxidoreductase [Lysobacter capsici]
MTAINSLALIALKCAPNVFDLSSDMTHASIRDQVVRARLLARDLAQLPKPPQSVLVVGAGFAGVSVAMALAAQKIKVLVVEVNRQPFQLQSKVSDRYVAPFMYEWPSHNADDQSYPPAGAPAWSDDSILAGLWDAPAIATLKQAGRDRGAWRKRWKRLHGVRSHGPYPAEPPHWDEWFVRELRGQVPLPAKELARRARARLLEHLAAIPPTSAQLKILTGVDADAIKRFVGAFAKQMGSWYQSMSSPPIPGSYRPWQHLRVVTGVDWLTSQPAHNVPCDVDAVILGGGAGPERVELDAYPFKFDAVGPAAGLSFWDNDGWLGASADDHVGVFGAGDGALQDALRALTGHKHPLMTIHAIRRDPRARAALTAVEPELAAIDRQNWLAASWTQVSEEKGKPRFHRGVLDEVLDQRCRAIACRLSEQPGINQAVADILLAGTGVVYHVFQENYFTKSYLLNRFLLHLIDVCQPPGGRLAGKIRYSSMPDMAEIRGYARSVVSARQGYQRADYRIWLKRRYSLSYFSVPMHRVAVRYGRLHPDSQPGHQLLGLSSEKIAERTCLGGVPYPHVAEPMP